MKKNHKGKLEINEYEYEPWKFNFKILINKIIHIWYFVINHKLLC